MHQLLFMLLVALLKLLILPTVALAELPRVPNNPHQIPQLGPTVGQQDLVEGCKTCRPAAPMQPDYQPVIWQPNQPVQPANPLLDEIEPTWWIHPDQGKRYLFLWQDSYRCLGYWDQQAQMYYPFKRGTQGRNYLGAPWEERKTNVPPLPLPSGYFAQGASVPDRPGHVFTGVDREKLSKTERYEINGNQVPPLAVNNKLELCDDSASCHVTVVTPDKRLREKILKDFVTHPALLSLKNRPRVQAYDPTQPVAAATLAPFQLERDERFRQTKFVMLIQPPEGADGKAPVTAFYSYEGPEAMAQAVRRVSPDSYDPNKNRAGDEDSALYLYLLVALVGAALLVAVYVITKNQAPAEE